MPGMCDLTDAVGGLDTNCKDYFYYAEHLHWLPYERELFSKEKVYREIEEDVDSEKIYLLIDDHDFTDGEGITHKRTFACAGNAVALTFMNDRFELLEKLLDAGISVQLEAPVTVCVYEGYQKLQNINTTLMDLMANFRETPDALFVSMWKRARETSAWPLKKDLQLQISYKEGEDNEGLLFNVKRLRSQWEAAADVLLRAWIYHYFDTLQGISAQTWEELFRELPDKGRLMFEAGVMSTFVLCKSKGFCRLHPTEKELLAVTELGRLFKRYGKDEEIKESRIFMAKIVSEEGSGWDEGFDRFFLELFSDIDNFKDLCPRERDSCVRQLLKENQVSLSVWRRILATDFVLEDLIDFYLEQIEKGENGENGMLLPMFISAKFRRKGDGKNGIVSG